MARSDFITLFSKIYKDKLDNKYLFKLFNDSLCDDALDKYREQGEEDWISDFRDNYIS